MTTVFNYNDIYHSIKAYISKEFEDSTPKTRDVTKCIKTFFEKRFCDYYVVLTSDNKEKEFLFDVSVCSASKEDCFKNNVPNFKMHLAVESELGGSGASNFEGLKNNIIIDFLKILVADSDYKVMIGISPEKQKEELINKLSEINEKSTNTKNILVVLLTGTFGGENIASKQIQVVKNTTINGYVLTKSQPYVERIE